MAEKVLILSPFDPLQPGGVERLIREFAVRLKGSFDIEIVGGGKVRSTYYLDGIPVHVLPSWTSSYSFMPHAIRLVRELEPSILYTHGFTQYVALVAMRLKQYDRKLKLVFHSHFHPTGSTSLFGLLRKVYDPLLGGLVINSADALIANSKSELRALKETFRIRPQTFVLPNGVDVEGIERAQKMTVDCCESPLLFVGRLEAYKNPATATKLMNYLPEKFHLFLAGTGPLLKSLTKAASKCAWGSRVHFLGYVPDDQLYGWYKASSVLVHFSTSESFGMTCLEALAAGTPSLANDDGFGLLETIELFPDFILKCNIRTQSFYDLAALIEKAANMKPVKANLSEYSWDKLSVRLKVILESTLSA